MQARWWAPTRGTTEPDAVVLALLTPDGDSAGDLGASLLGLHRAGAASCELVAKGAVPSEFDLVKALTSTNALLSEHLSASVSKSLEPNYAGLLIRDVIADADAAALSLFRTCVSKGVAPPLAVSRVGAVYGVPSRDLGKYSVLATDPKANPIALTDAADRALLGYVAKLVASEVGEVKELVSKAPTAFVESDVRRDYQGRFATELDTPPVKTPPVSGPLVALGQEDQRPAPMSPLARLRAKLGLGTTAPEIVVEPDVAQAPPKPQSRRRVRTDDKRRVKRAPVASPTTSSGQLVSTDRKLATRHVPLKSAQVKLKAKDIELQAKTMVAVRRQLGEQTKEIVAVKDMRAIAPEGKPKSDFMTMPYPDRAPYPEMWASLIWHMPGKPGADFRKQTVGQATVDSPRRFRMKYLLDAAGQPEEHDLEGYTEKKTPEYTARAVAADAAKAEMPAGYVEPKTQHLDWVKFENESTYLAARGQKAQMAVEAGYEGEDERNLEMSHMESVQDYYNGMETIVYHQPQVDPVTGETNNDYSRPIPIVDEYSISANYRFRGVDESGSDTDVNSDWSMDENQAYTIDEEYLTFWDPKNHVIVHRWFITPVDEDEADEFGKALTMATAVEFEHEHPRSREGRFVPKSQGASLVAPTAMSGTPLSRLRTKFGLVEVSQGPTTVVEPAAAARAVPMRRIQRNSRTRADSRRIVRARAEQAPQQFTAASANLKAQDRTLQATDTPLQAKLRRLLSSVSLAQAEQAERSDVHDIPDMPVLSDTSEFKVLSGADWGAILADLSDEAQITLGTKGGVVPIYNYTKNQIITAGEREGLTDFTQAQRDIIGHVSDRMQNTEHDFTRRKLGKPIVIGDSVDEEKALWHHIDDAFDEHPEVEQIEIHRNEGSGVGHVIQLYGSTVPISVQYILEIDPSEVNLQDGSQHLEIVNLGEHRTKSVHVDKNGMMAPMLPADMAARNRSDVGALNVSVQIFKVISAKVQRNRVQPE